MNVIRAKSHHLKLKSRGFIRNIYLLQRGIYGQKFDILILHCTATEKKKKYGTHTFQPKRPDSYLLENKSCCYFVSLKLQ